MGNKKGPHLFDGVKFFLYLCGMKKLFIILMVGGLLSGCYRESQSSETLGKNIKVEFLFEKDGIKVYRFNDGNYHYFTSRGETMTSQGSGKTTYEENIP